MGYIIITITIFSIVIIINILIVIVFILIMIAVDHLGLAKCLPVAHNTTPNNSITIVINIKEIIVIVIKIKASLAQICIITTS